MSHSVYDTCAQSFNVIVNESYIIDKIRLHLVLYHKTAGYCWGLWREQQEYFKNNICRCLKL